MIMVDFKFNSENIYSLLIIINWLKIHEFFVFFLYKKLEIYYISKITNLSY